MSLAALQYYAALLRVTHSNTILLLTMTRGYFINRTHKVHMEMINISNNFKLNHLYIHKTQYGRP